MYVHSVSTLSLFNDNNNTYIQTVPYCLQEMPTIIQACCIHTIQTICLPSVGVFCPSLPQETLTQPHCTKRTPQTSGLLSVCALLPIIACTQEMTNTITGTLYRHLVCYQYVPCAALALYGAYVMKIPQAYMRLPSPSYCCHCLTHYGVRGATSSGMTMG
jgi:hypothetical protein